MVLNGMRLHVLFYACRYEIIFWGVCALIYLMLDIQQNNSEVVSPDILLHIAHLLHKGVANFVN